MITRRGLLELGGVAGVLGVRRPPEPRSVRERIRPRPSDDVARDPRTWGLRMGGSSWPHPVITPESDALLLARGQLTTIDAQGEACALTGVQTDIATTEVIRFCCVIQTDDIVVLLDPRSGRMHLGRVSGPATWSRTVPESCMYQARRPVDWVVRDVPRHDLSFSLAAAHARALTIFSLDEFADEIRLLMTDDLETVVGLSRAGRCERDPARRLLVRLQRVPPERFREVIHGCLGLLGFQRANVDPEVGGEVSMTGVLDHWMAEVLLRIRVMRGPGRPGRETVQAMAERLEEGERGVIISLCGFTEDARQASDAPGRRRVALVDGPTFAALLLSRSEDVTSRLADPVRALMIGQ